MGQFVQDTFTDTASTALTSHTGEVGATWTKHNIANNTGNAQINGSNQLETTETSKNEAYYASGSPSSADYTVSFRYTHKGGSGAIGFVGARLSTSASTGYFGGIFQGVGCSLYKYVSGTLTALASAVAFTLTTDESYDITIDVSGTTIAIRLQVVSTGNWLKPDGSLQASQINYISVTDSAISAAGKAGFWISHASGTRAQYDNFSADEAVSAIAVPTGTLTLSGFAPTVTNSNGNTIDVPAAALTLTGYAPSIASTNVIAVTDSNWKWSPYNWATVGSQKVAVNGGAYFKLGFTGTAVSIALDVSSLVAGSVSAGHYPSLRYMVDNGAQTDVQLTSSSTELAVSGLSSGTHTIEVWYVSGLWEDSGTDRWTTPVYCIKVGEATLDTGASSSAPTWYTNSLIFFGDSIGEGIRANYSTTQPACQNAYDSMPVYLARALECELGNVSFGGLNYNSGYGSIPSFLSGYGSIYSGQSRLTGGELTPDPAYACIWYGANGAPSQANVESAIGILRTIAPTSLICVIVPIGGYGRASITAAVAAYKASNPTERRVHLIDLGTGWQVGLDSFGSATQQAIDGLHPRANWNARIGAAYAARIASLRALTTTTKTVSLTLTTDGSTAAASLTGLKWAWWDQITPDVMASPPADMGVAETTDGSGVLTIAVRTTLAVSGVGWLVVTDSDGTTTQSPAHKLFSGPVTVS